MSPTASAATAIPLSAASATAAGPADPLSEEFKTQALAVLTRRMGPIARVMTRRAGDASGGSRARFIQALVDALPEADRWTVQGELNKLP